MNPEIRFRVPQHVWDLAQQAAERHGLEEQRGKTGGASQLARGALYTALGLALPEDLHALQSRTFADVRQARLERETEGPPTLRVEVHHRIAPDFRKISVLRNGRPVAARTTTVLEFGQGELPDFLVPYVTLSDSGLPRASLNLEGKLSPRRHALGELVSATDRCTLEELALCLAGLKKTRTDKARRSEEHEMRTLKGGEVLAKWASKHGSGLLRARLAGGFSWLDLAQQEYAAARLVGFGLKDAIAAEVYAASAGMTEHLKLHVQAEPTLATMERLRSLESFAAEAGFAASAVYFQQPDGQFFEAIRLRVETPVPGRRTFLLDPIALPGGPQIHGL